VINRPVDRPPQFFTLNLVDPWLRGV